MAPEIADSDGESEDLTEQVEGGHSPPPAATSQHDHPNDQVSPPQVDFDEFIDPTQRLSDLAASPSSLRGTGSTEKILKSLERARRELGSSTSDGNMNNRTTISFGMDGSSPLLSRKRGQSAIDNGSAVGSEHTSKKKRAKTYSTKARNTNTQSSGLFADVDLSDPTQIAPKGGESDEQLSTEPSMAPPEQQGPPRERDRPRRVISLLHQSTTDPVHNFSTSTSSMGGYQSINLDYRGSGQGLDINANPFGSLSQISVDGEMAHADLTQAQDLYGNVEQADTINPSALQNQNIETEMMTSPERPTNSTILLSDPTEEVAHDLAQATDRPNKRRKTDLGGSRSAASPAPASTRRAASVSAESVSNASNASSKKRGRISKPSKPPPSSPAPEIEAQDLPEANEDHHAMEPPPSRSKRSRRNTLDTSSQNSEPVSNTKRKRKNTKTGQAPGSPIKNTSGELNLSDELAVGLPKEQYKPRPSRSRSKRSVDDEDVVDPTQVDKQADASAEVHVGVEIPKPAKGKAKGKKSKVKRAKTSGVALKKSESMLSEGEDDVLFMDEKPATVKLDLPADLGILKKEEDANDNDNDDEDDMVKTGGRAKKNIRVEIPPAADAQVDGGRDTPKAGSKKRGRKPKNQTPSAPTPEPLTEPEEEVEEPSTTNADGRAVLAPKDHNTPSLPPPTSNSKPTDKENAPTPSPTKPTSTTHSPLKTASTMESTSRFRVGLSKRQSIPSLLRRVDKTKKAPTKVSTTVKERKVKTTDGGSGDEGDGLEKLALRDGNGELIEWEF